MSSQSEDDRQNKQDQSNQNDNHNNNHYDHSRNPSLDANFNQPTPASLPPPMPPMSPSPHGHGYPPPMGGYPPHMVHRNGGQYPVGYPPPPPHGYNQYGYVQGPPGGCYYNPRIPLQTESSRKLVRLLAVIVFLGVSLWIFWNLLTLAILREEVPVAYVENLSVSNLNTSTPFTATFYTNFTVENPNHKIRIYIDKFMADIFHYDDEVYHYPLASSWLQPVFINTKTNKTLNAVLSANGSAEEAVPIWLTEDMSKDIKQGSLTFTLGLQIWATLKYNTWYSSTQEILCECKNLNVHFAADHSGNGALQHGKHDCSCYCL